MKLLKSEMKFIGSAYTLADAERLAVGKGKVKRSYYIEYNVDTDMYDVFRVKGNAQYD